MCAMKKTRRRGPCEYAGNPLRGYECGGNYSTAPNCDITGNNPPPSRGGYRICERGGALYIFPRCQRQCIGVCSADQSARSVENFFRLHFSLIRMGSRGTFVLCTASSRCTRIAGPGAARPPCVLKFRSRT